VIHSDSLESIFILYWVKDFTQYSTPKYSEMLAGLLTVILLPHEVASVLVWSHPSMQRILVVSHRRLGTSYRSHRQGSSSPRRIHWTAWVKTMGLIGCSETSVT